MRTKIATIALVSMLTALTFRSTGSATAAGGATALEDLARAALDGSPAEAAGAIAGLRQAGPAGMDTLLALAGSGETLDRVCGVKDCADIRLFWYTDLEAAKAAARAEGKPILSLRLLGRLDEEFSCANSRFFRTVFYKNAEINELLRKRFILHWRSVRPVPKVTIDFGDGTRLEQTLTGNSIHYVLDSRGRLLDALPGLYGPEAFRSALFDAAQAARKAVHLDDAQFVAWATDRHRRQLDARAEAFRREGRALAPATAEKRSPAMEIPTPQTRPVAVPAARPVPEPRPEMAEERAALPAARDPWAILRSTPGVLTDRIEVGGIETGSKNAFEASLLQAFESVSDDQLRGLGRLRRARIHLDPESRAFLLRKHGVTDPGWAERLVDSFETTIALDEVINEYRLGPAILRRLSNAGVRKNLDLEAFNLWIYEEVFRTPLSDPWLGLAPRDVYGALPASARTAAAQPER